jgi:excisionase family DNA binding protein
MQVMFVPFVTRARFAELVGVSQDTLEHWIRAGRVKTYKIGKRSLVDLRQWFTLQEAA